MVTRQPAWEIMFIFIVGGVSQSVRECFKENVRDEPLWKRILDKEKQALSLSFGHEDLSYPDLRGI